jgi:hypothetical protein
MWTTPRAGARSGQDEDVAVLAGLEPDEREPEPDPDDPEPDDLPPDEPEPEPEPEPDELEPEPDDSEDDFEPEPAGVAAGVEEESDLLSAAAGAADFSALTSPARESLR